MRRRYATAEAVVNFACNRAQKGIFRPEVITYHMAETYAFNQNLSAEKFIDSAPGSKLTRSDQVIRTVGREGV